MKKVTKRSFPLEMIEAMKAFKNRFGIGVEVELGTSIKCIDDSSGFMSSGSNGYISALRINPNNKHFEYYLCFWNYGWRDAEIVEEDYSDSFLNFGLQAITQALDENGAKYSYDEAKEYIQNCYKNGNKKEITKAYKEENLPDPKFMDTEELYNLWAHRHSPKPISYNELYKIINQIFTKTNN